MAVNLLNPSVIVIGGSLGQAGELLMAGVREVVYRRSLPLATTHLRIALSVAGDQTAIFGASRMVTQYVLSPAAIESTIQAAGRADSTGTHGAVITRTGEPSSQALTSSNAPP
jgi:hypothetical protein